MTENKTDIFRISPIIRITLITFYFSLTIPFPFLTKVTNSPISPNIIWGGIIVGLLLLYAALSERVIISDRSIQVSYPFWVLPFFRKGWSLDWNDIKNLKMRTTGQGGLIYYLITNSEEAFLLPMRIAGFSRLVNIIQAKTGIDTNDIRPLSQPWMYFILFVFSVLLLLMDIWTIYTANHFILS
ncbi:MAG TPA: hypothetical protein V6C58_00600 [Allocoleopsis sp.]